MRNLKAITYCTLLLTTPSLFSYPPDNLPPAEVQQSELERPLTYDEILEILDDLESDELEKKYFPSQLEQLNEFIAALATEGTLVLETVAEIGNSAKIKEVVSLGKTTMFMGEELGFTSREMGQLKKVGKLESAIDDACESWLAKSSSEAYNTAKKGGKHSTTLLINLSKKSKNPSKALKN